MAFWTHDRRLPCDTQRACLYALGNISASGPELAALAGDDLLLCAGRWVGEGQQALAALASGYADGQLSRPEAAAAVASFLALRASLAG